jgi:cell division protein FtsQ
MPRVKRPRPSPFVQDRPSRRQVFLRRVRRAVAPLAAGVVLLGVIGAGAGLVHMFGQGESFRERVGNATAALGLRVRDVVIEGRQKTPEPLLRAAIGVAPGDPILSFSVADARTRIETIRWVQSASVTRRLPDTILVSLVERRPFAVWQHDGKFVLIDRDGQLVTDSDVGAFASELPLVVGEGAPVAAAALIDALAAQPAIQARVTAAVRVGERRWNLRLNNGTDVLLPEGAEAPALARLAELQSAHALLDRPLQALDLRLPDRLVFRPQPMRGPDGKDAPPQAPSAQARKPT